MKISKEVKVGFFMVFAIAILYIGFNYLKGTEFFSTSKKYYAVYENVDGLNVSNSVYINGFVVGKVSDITLLQADEDKILVELDIDGDIVLGDSATSTLTGDFLGNKSILINTGNISRPLESGDTLIAVLDRGIADILTQSAQPVANSLEVTIKKINTILDNLSGNSDKVNRMMDSFEKTPVLLNATIADARYDLNKITESFNELSAKMNSTLSASEPMLNNLAVFTDSLKRLELNKTIQEANLAIANLNKAVEQFSQNKGTLGKLINDDSLYVNLNNAAENLDRLLIHLDTRPKDFFSPFGRNTDKIERRRKKAAD